MRKKTYRNNNSRRACAAAFALAALIAVASFTVAGTAAAEPLKIRAASGSSVSGVITPIIPHLKHVLKHYGKSYTLDLTMFRGSSPQIQAFAAKQLDIGYLSFSSFPVSILNANLDLQIVGDMVQEGKGGYFSSVRAVRADSDIRKIEDLRGKKIGIIAYGTGTDLGNRTILKRHGLEFKKDYTMVEVRPPAMGAMLRSGKIDLAWLTVPFWYIEKRKGNVRKLFDGVDAMGVTQVLVFTARRAFLQANKAAMQDFFEDYLRSLRYVIDPKNRDEVVAIAARITKRPKRALASFIFTKRDYYKDPNGLPDLKALQSNIDLLREMGFIKKAFDVNDHLDLSFMKEAAKRLGG